MPWRRRDRTYNVWDWSVIDNCAVIFCKSGPPVDELDWSDNVGDLKRTQFCLWGAETIYAKQ